MSSAKKRVKGNGLNELYGDFEARKAKLLSQFDDFLPLAREFCEELESYFRKLVDGTSSLRGKVQFVLARVKGRSSFLRKISRPRRNPYTSIEEITDLIGIRIITLFETDVDRVGALVQKHFWIDEENSVDKRTTHSAAVFGYLSRHFVFAVKKAKSKDLTWARFTHMKAEIQIRSVAQHAWAEVEHGLGYHAKLGIPDPLKRRFARQAALLEVVDREFVSLADEVAKYRKRVERPLNDASIDIESLGGLVEHDKVSLRLDSKIAKGGLGLNPEINRDFVEFLVRMLEWIDVKSIGEARDIVLMVEPILPEYAAYWITRKRSMDRGISMMYAIYFFVASTSIGRELKAFQSHFGLGKHVDDFHLRLLASVEEYKSVSRICVKWAVSKYKPLPP